MIQVEEKKEIWFKKNKEEEEEELERTRGRASEKEEEEEGEEKKKKKLYENYSTSLGRAIYEERVSQKKKSER